MITVNMKLDAIMQAMTAEDTGAYNAAMTQIREYMKSDGSQKCADAEECIVDTLLELGVPNHVKGYPYLLTAIGMVVENPNLIAQITKVLYCDVADIHHTSASRAERAIRHAIEICWDRIDLDTSFRYFGNTISPIKGKPTNGEFIARVANVVRRRMKDAV